MNEIFIRFTFNELEMLKENSWENIQAILKKHNKEKDTIGFKFSIFLKKVIYNDITTKEIDDFLSLKFKDGNVSDYLSVIRNDKDNAFLIKNKKYDKVFDLSKGLPIIDKTVLQFNTYVQNPIINLITLYESFIKQLISFDCAEGDYEIIKNESITFDKLLTLNYDEEKIRNSIVKSYCNSKLYGDKKRIEEIISTFKIDCDDCADLIDDFKELYFRRNMYVHSINDVTSDYQSLPDAVLKKWSKNGELIDSPKYFNHAFDTMYKIFLMIFIKKCLYKQKSEEDLNSIEQILFEEIYCKKLYSVAKFGYEQLEKLGWIGKAARYRCFINYMHCLKKLESDKLSKELSKWDTNTDANIYKLAKKLIENDYKNINDLILKILKDDNEFDKLSDDDKSLYITKEDIETWPLFEDYRKSEEYILFKTKVNNKK